MSLEKIQAEWNLKPLLESEDEALIEKKRTAWKEKTVSFISKWKNRQDYLENPGVLKEALDEYEDWMRTHADSADELFYYWLKSNLDQKNPKTKAKFNKVEEFSKKISNDMQFFTLNISKLPKEKQNKFLEDQELEGYHYFLERLFEKAKHMLSESEEKIMTLKSSSAHDLWTKMVSELISKEERRVLDEAGNKVVKSFSSIFNLMNNQDKTIRDKAGNEFDDILKKYVDIATAEINAILANKKIDDELRNYIRPDQKRHVKDNIESEIIDVIIKAVSSRFNISHRYYQLKAALLGTKQLEYYERNVEFGKIEKSYSYADAVKLVYDVFNKLDPQFAKILKDFVENGQIDAHPKKGKSDGAFCIHILKTQPTYVLLNHSGTLADVLVLAHELGHAINSEFLKSNQNALYADTTTAINEVASTFMEDFVLEKLQEDADDELKLALMMQKLNRDISTIIRQIACYMFEQELHKKFREKGHLSKDDIGSLFQKHMSAYMGPAVKQYDGSENWWVYWSHIRNFFYNYSYVSGLLISKAMQKSVKENPEFIDKVKLFLSTGVSESPKDIFLKMGIDVTKEAFWEKGLDEVEALLNETEALAKKLGKI